jgi:YVTN family beta-propeller protein
VGVPAVAAALTGASLQMAAPIKVCSSATVVELVGHKGLVFGTVTVSNDDDAVTVLYETSGDWELLETHLAVTISPTDIPLNPAGRPDVGRFPHVAIHAPGTTAFFVSLPLDGLGVQAQDELIVAAHVDVIDRNDPNDPDDDQTEGGWADGVSFTKQPRGNVGRYVEHTIQGCTEVTQTVGVEGGTIEADGRSPDEGVTLVIPPGALSQPVEITIEAVPLSEIGVPGVDRLIEGTAYDFGPDGLQFLQPVLITIGYDESVLGSDPESTISIFRVDGGLERIAGTVDEVNNEVSALVEHFTVYVTGTDDGFAMLIAESVGVTDDVTITVLSTIRPDIAEAIGVTDDVAIIVSPPPGSDVAESIGVVDDVTIAVRSPIQPDLAEPIGVTDDVTITVLSTLRPAIAELIGVTDDVTITVEPASTGNFAYVALQGADSVAVIDRDTNTLLTRISVGQFPFAVAVRPDGSEVYVTNRGDGSVSVIDVATQSLVGSIPNVVNDPIDIAFSPDGSTAYVVDNDASLIGVIDVTTRSVGTPLVGSTRLARSIAVTASGDAAYVAGVDSLVVFDLTAGTPVDTVTGVFSTGDLTLTPDDSELWLTDSADDEVLVFDRATAAITGTVTGIPAPQGIDIGGTSTTAWVADGGSSITPIDIVLRMAGAVVGLSFEADWLAISADGSRAYVSEGRQGTQLAVVDLTTGSVVTTMAVGSSPAKVGVTR